MSFAQPNLPILIKEIEALIEQHELTARGKPRHE